MQEWFDELVIERVEIICEVPEEPVCDCDGGHPGLGGILGRIFEIFPREEVAPRGSKHS